MKTMKKLFAILLAVVMVMGLAITAMAADVTNATDNHTYDAYQIFSGTQAENSVKLGDVEWGSGIKSEDDDNSAEFLAALKADKRFGEGEENIFFACVTAKDVAETLADNQDAAEDFADVAVEHLTATKTTIVPAETVNLAAGYWLIVDTTVVDNKHDAKNHALLQVTNDGAIEITKKYDVPKVEKTVDDPDANIGDAVTFTLTATMPSNLEGYETYKVIFHDTLSAGLTYTNTVEVTIDGADKTAAFNPVHSNGTLTVSCDDVLAQGAKESSIIVVTYTAVLNENAVIGPSGNPNTVYLEYSNNPNWDGDGDEPTGKTPEEIVYVYTWELPAIKVDGADNTVTLAGAKFVLYKDEECTEAINLVALGENVYQVCTLSGEEHNTVEDVAHNVENHVTEIETDETGKFEFEGLEQGTYYLKETKAPAGYNLLTKPTAVVIGKNGVLNPAEGEDGAVTGATKIAVENNSGATLPETGGMGTTLFYILGGVLVLAAVVLLVTKRRMSAAE